MVLQSKVLVQWLNFHSVNKEITCSVTEFSLSEQGLYFMYLAALWPRNIITNEHSDIAYWHNGNHLQMPLANSCFYANICNIAELSGISSFIQWFSFGSADTSIPLNGKSKLIFCLTMAEIISPLSYTLWRIGSFHCSLYDYIESRFFKAQHEKL